MSHACRLFLVLAMAVGASAADAAAQLASAPPKGFRSVTPYLYVDDATAAIAFYVKAFDAEELYGYPNEDGAIVHAEIRIGEASIMIGDADVRPDTKPPQAGAPRSSGVHLYVRDVDAVFAQAVAAGAKAVVPPADMPWGHRFALVMDPHGHAWSIATPGADAPPAEAEGKDQPEAEAPDGKGKDF